MWGSGLFGHINIPVPITTAASPADLEEAKKKSEAVKLVEETGLAVCVECNQDIRKNEATIAGGWTWESEDMLGWCDAAKDRKHKPKIVWEGMKNG